MRADRACLGDNRVHLARPAFSDLRRAGQSSFQGGVGTAGGDQLPVLLLYHRRMPIHQLTRQARHLLTRAADRFRSRLQRSSRRRHRPGRTEQRAGAFDHRQRLGRLKLNGHATNYRACRALVTAGVSPAARLPVAMSVAAGGQLNTL